MGQSKDSESLRTDSNTERETVNKYPKVATYVTTRDGFLDWKFATIIMYAASTFY